MSIYKSILVITALFLATYGALLAQSDTIKNLQEVEIVATRLSNTDTKAPLSVSVIDKFRLQTATQQLSPYESLGAIPGVFAMNPDNFSQDLRISIRGFGARAAFGIRGIRMYVDGLPEGTPDGQVDVDNLDMGVVRQMEVIRGAASAIYGNASGGVIYMLTENPTTRKPSIEIQMSAGSYGFRRFQLKFGQKFNKLLYFVNASHNRNEGYRAWSQMQNSILNGKLVYQPNERTTLSILTNYGTSPTANDAGGLALSQWQGNPTQAGINNLLFETGETLTQGRVGATLETHPKNNHTLSARAFYTARHLVNRLAVAANGFGDLQRNFYGFGASYQIEIAQTAGVKLRYKLGFDADNQQDIRQRFAYLKTTQNAQIKYLQDKQVLNQLENFRSVGLYLLNDIKINDKWQTMLGLRYDILTLSATDRFLTDGDQSGQRHFAKFNPMFGLNFEWAKHHAFYANVSSSFESPTLNELSNNPDNTGGFNANLLPQQASSTEFGTKGILRKIKYDIAVFNIWTTNDLVPFQIAGQTGKTFYRNAGKTQRKGVEIGVNWQIYKGLSLFYTQTMSKFRYHVYSVNATVFDGKQLPGIPQNYSQIELRYFAKKGFFLIVQNRNASKMYANDANTAEANGYSILNLRAGYNLTLKYLQIEPFFGVNNATNQSYAANVQINAQAERYFEPAAMQHYFGGLKIRL